MIEELPQPQGFMHWLKESVTVKLGFIAVLVILLLIPSAMINELIRERAARQDETIKEVSDQYSGSQLIQGPILMIPYKKQLQENDSAGKPMTREIIQNIYILPDQLNYKASLVPEILHRGIFEVAVYNSTIKVSGNFLKANLSALSIPADRLLPERAKLLFCVSDLKGLKTNPQISAAGQTLIAEPAYGDNIFSNGLQVSVNLTGMVDQSVPFEFALDLKGSQELSFLHLGKTTDVEASGKWSGPEFDGRYLPDTRKVDSDGFSAKWRMLYYNRPFPQQWADDNSLLSTNKKIDDATFGVKLRLPVDQYQKTTRSSKYSLLIIMLTFISLFLTELIGKQKVHVFNYLLIGASMIIYYTLLLSLSEQLGFNPAYLIASVATIALIAVFLASILKNRKASVLFAFILTLFYTFIYVIIQLEDLALMIGSIALFIIIAVLMYFSRKISWDKQ